MKDSNHHEPLRNDRTGKRSVKTKGVTKRIKKYFWDNPNSNAPACCRELKLNYKKYRGMCYKWKSKTKAILAGKVQGRVHKVPSHRLEWRTEKPLGVGYVQSLLVEALRRTPGRDDPKPFDEWYVIPNRNRQLQFTNDFVSIRVFIRSGTCRILPRAPMDFESLKIHVQNAFFKAGLDLRKCEDLSGKLEPHDRHRMFRIGPVTPFKVDFYKNSLGLTLKADGSHPLHIEGIEGWPSWIKPLIKTNVDLATTVGELGTVVADFKVSLREHLQLVRTLSRESEQRNTATLNLINTLTKAVERLPGGPPGFKSRPRERRQKRVKRHRKKRRKRH